MAQVTVTGSIPGQLVWTPFGYIQQPSTPAVAIIEVDDTGKPVLQGGLLNCQVTPNIVNPTTS